MGCYCRLSVKQCENVAFDSVEQLNLELASKSGVAELLECYPSNGFIKLNKDKVSFFDREGESYFKSGVDVWGCVQKNEFNIIAKHMINGKLVLELATEGNGEETFVLTPNECHKAKINYE